MTVDLRDATLDTGDATVVTPTDLAEARDALADTAGAVLFRGGRTKLSWGAPPTAVDVVVDTSAMTDVLTHDAADATVSVQAGVRLADLQRVLAEHDQRLAIDPPGADDGVTVGGLLAADDAGPDRLRHGTMRDLVIGATFVLSDGTVGRTGGFVIKNVAGYDIAKLLCGSLGTLALVVEIVLRVHPVPAATGTVCVAADASAAVGLTTRLGGAPLEPVAMDWTDDTLYVRFAGAREAVDDQITRTRSIVGNDVEVSGGSDDATLWRRLTDDLAGVDGETVVRGACLPTDLARAAAALDDAAAGAGVRAELGAHVALGALTARVSGGDAESHARFVRDWRTRLVELGGHAVVRRRVAGLDGLVDPWGPPPSAIGLMRQVKRSLDPDNRCAPGRFVGGI